MKPEVFKQMLLRDMTQHLDEDNYLDCLRSVCEHMCDLIAAHTSMRTWLQGKKEEDLLGTALSSYPFISDPLLLSSSITCYARNATYSMCTWLLLFPLLSMLILQRYFLSLISFFKNLHRKGKGERSSISIRRNREEE
jgi:hypothetical protein